jgi:hypothetical protein
MRRSQGGANRGVDVVERGTGADLLSRRFERGDHRGGPGATPVGGGRARVESAAERRALYFFPPPFPPASLPFSSSFGFSRRRTTFSRWTLPSASVTTSANV